MEIVLACDLVVASPRATFSLPEVRRGLVPGMAVFAASRVLPVNVAHELSLTGAPLTAERAFQLGFVNRLAEAGTVLESARTLAEEIAANAPMSVRATLHATNDFLSQSDTLGWMLADRARCEIADSEDAAEGVAAFLEKRPPLWRGR
jgi:enoyl-CoA hydratase